MSGRLYNCAAVLQSGAILGIVPKTYIPNYNEYYEKRWFASSEKVNCSSVIIDDEEVPFGSNLLLLCHLELFSELKSVRICGFPFRRAASFALTVPIL